MFERAFAMFAPFARPGGGPATPGAAGEGEKTPPSTDEIDELKKQMEEMQKRINRLGSDENK